MLSLWPDCCFAWEAAARVTRSSLSPFAHCASPAPRASDAMADARAYAEDGHRLGRVVLLSFVRTDSHARRSRDTSFHGMGKRECGQWASWGACWELACCSTESCAATVGPSPACRSLTEMLC